MGINCDLICGQFKSESLNCFICKSLLDYPICLKTCHHIFCRSCVSELFQNQGIQAQCPQPGCEKTFCLQDLQSPPLFCQSVLAEVQLKCPWQCGEILPYNTFHRHRENCVKGQLEKANQLNKLKDAKILDLEKQLEQFQAATNVVPRKMLKARKSTGYKYGVRKTYEKIRQSRPGTKSENDERRIQIQNGSIYHSGFDQILQPDSIGPSGRQQYIFMNTEARITLHYGEIFRRSCWYIDYQDNSRGMGERITRFINWSEALEPPSQEWHYLPSGVATPMENILPAPQFTVSQI